MTPHNLRVNALFMTVTVHVIITGAIKPVGLNDADSYCRDRLGLFRTEEFKISTCTMCYFYLVLQQPTYMLNKAPKFLYIHQTPYHLISRVKDGEGRREIIYPTLDNTTTLDIVCESLDKHDCKRWKLCCNYAWNCCQNQLKYPEQVYEDEQMNSVEKQVTCPQTFDGWSCWSSARANTTVSSPCPSFLGTGTTDAHSHKTCRGDGTWEISPDTGLEQTDYGECREVAEIKTQKRAIVLSIVLNTVGSVMIFPAICLFSNSRILRKQQRIKIHMNLFMSLVLTSILNIIWDVCVTLDRIDHVKAESFLHRQQALCKTIYVLHQCVRASTYFWMSCEGYFLHRLMVNAFLPAKHFYGYMIYGWGVPFVLFTTYGGVRKAIADDSMCWILPLDGSSRVLEWVLVFAPIVGCLLANLFFFGNILKLMLTKLVVHPEEPSKFRRAIKATSLLVPLFGLHLFCFMYRPKGTEGTGYDVYEIFSAIILNSQGIFVSLLLFYCNGEVQTHIASKFSHWRKKQLSFRHGDNRKWSMSMTGSASRRTSVSSSQTMGVSDALTTDDTSPPAVTQTTKF